jgi:hypothetical protein
MVSAAWSKEYVKPLRCSFDIYDLNEETHYRYYDPFNIDANDLYPQSISLNLREGGFGDATISIFDDGNTFDRYTEGIRGTVKFSIGKNPDQMVPVITCVNPRLVTRRPDTNLMYKDIICDGKITMMDERLITFIKHAAYANIDDSTLLSPITDMTASNLMTELFTNESLMPLGDIEDSLEEHGNYNISGISKKVNDFIASLDMDLANARTVAETIANSVGAIFRVGRTNDVILEYPHEIHTGILITGDDPCNPNKNGWTAFPVGGWQFTDEWSLSAGNATAIVGTTENPFDTSDSGAGTNVSREKLFNRDLCQQIDLTTADLAQLVLVLARIGDPDDKPKSRMGLEWHLVYDNNNQPTGKKIAEGNIDIKKIPEEDPKPMFISKIKFRKKPIWGQKAWIKLFRTGQDADNTVAWYHSGTQDSTSGFRDIEAEDSKPIDLRHPDHNKDNNPAWTVSVLTGHKFTYSLFDIATYLTQAYDYRAKKRFGWVDKFIDFSFTSHTNTAMLAANAYLAEATKVRRTFDFPVLTIPDHPHFFYPDEWVTVHDQLSGLTPQNNYMFKITSVGVVFQSPPDDTSNPFGARTCHVAGVGFADYLNDGDGDPEWS